MTSPLLRWSVLAVLAAGLLAACASHLAERIPAYPGAGTLETDTRECEQAATGRAEFARRADYMACMIARGYRTYVSAATYWRMAELTVVARRGQPQSQVLIDLHGCATDSGAVAGARPLEIADAVDWVNARLGRGAPTARWPDSSRNVSPDAATRPRWSGGPRTDSPAPPASRTSVPTGRPLRPSWPGRPR